MDRADQAQLQPLDEDDCKRLVTTQDVGRLVIGSTVPNIRPVNYAVSADRIFIRTDVALPVEADVAFEVDQIDAASREGWSVVARGVLHPVDACDVPEAARLTRPWAGGEKHAWSVIDVDALTGRRVRAAQSTETGDSRGYL